jgi:hypothetical protein
MRLDRLGLPPAFPTAQQMHSNFAQNLILSAKSTTNLVMKAFCAKSLDVKSAFKIPICSDVHSHSVRKLNRNRENRRKWVFSSPLSTVAHKSKFRTKRIRYQARDVEQWKLAEKLRSNCASKINITNDIMNLSTAAKTYSAFAAADFSASAVRFG